MTDDEGLRHRELAAFLRTRRERLRPESAGLPPGRRRRTPGLRREEVAALAGVGVTWYTWLEQGRRIRVSAQVLGAIAGTLRLDPMERAHLFTLAGVTDPAGPAAPEPVPAPVLAILDALAPYPAYVLDEQWNVLGWNTSACCLLVDFAAVPPGQRNIMRLMFTNPQLRECMPDWDLDASLHVGMLRATLARHAGEPAWQRFLDEMREASPEFVEFWDRHELARPQTRRKRFQFPGIGIIRLESTSLWLSEQPGTRLNVHVPADNEAALALRRLVDSRSSGAGAAASGTTGQRPASSRLTAASRSR